MENKISIFNQFNITNLQSFQHFINQIKNNDALFQKYNIKWKNDSNQIVLETNQFFYKIYQIDIARDFSAKIRTQLAQIYRQKYNIIWNIITLQHNNIIYQIQQRQKLKQITEKDFSLTEILLQWKQTLIQLQNKLLLPKICTQLNLNYKSCYDVSKLKLIRDCVNKHKDYALTPDNKIILLDDNDFFIAMIDKNGNWLQKKIEAFNCITSIGQRLLSFDGLDWSKIIQKTTQKYNKWQFYNTNHYGTNKTILDFKNQREQMIKNNIRILI